MYNAISYCRVSTTNQKRNGNSLEDQERYNQEYCERNNLKLVKVFKDDFTGTTIKRPALNDLFTYLEQHP